MNTTKISYKRQLINSFVIIGGSLVAITGYLGNYISHWLHSI